MASAKTSMLLVLAVLAGTTIAFADVEADLRQEARRAPGDGAAALTLARRLRRAGLHDEAVRVARQAFASARVAPLAGDLLLEVARARIAQRDQKAALRECARLEKLDVVGWQVCIAETQLLRRRGSLALPAAEDALALQPGRYDARVARARALALLGKPLDAEAELRGAIHAEPRRPEGHVALAGLLAEAGDLAGVTKVLRAAVVDVPDDPDVLLLVGQHAKDPIEAVNALRAATVARPSDAVAHALLGRRLRDRGDLAGAIASLGHAIRLDGRQADWHAQIGDAYLAGHEPDKALTAARAALGIVGNHAHAKLVEADALADQGEIDSAIVAFQAAASLARRDPRPLVDATVACLKHGRATTAYAFADRAVEEFPSWGPAWVAKGDAAQAAGERAAARAAYARALEARGPVDVRAVEKKLSAVK